MSKNKVKMTSPGFILIAQRKPKLVYYYKTISRLDNTYYCSAQIIHTMIKQRFIAG